MKTLFVSLLQLLLAAIASSAYCRPPNIVLILADDLGWGDPQCYQPDSKIPTPWLDQLAADGIRFTDAHTPSSVCTPTRYTLLTGRYCWRTWLEKGVLDGFGPPLIGSGEVTLASMAKRCGYSTACIGKWHLGMQWYTREGEPIGQRGPGGFRPGDDVDFDRDLTGGPNDVGFDQFFGISASLDMSPYAFICDRRVEVMPTKWHKKIDDTIFLNGVSGVRSPDFEVSEVLTRFGDEAVKTIKSFSDLGQPFFLYLPLNSPHLPVAPSAYAKGKSNAGEYGDFAWQTDQVVGRVVEALSENGQQDHSLVIFTSDNGGLWHWWDFRADDDGGKAPITPRGAYVKRFSHQSNADWRGTKADIYEGGHRVPLIMKWPKEIKAGRVCDSLVELTDIYATIAEVLGRPQQSGTSGMDSYSLLPILRGSEKSARPFSVHHSLSGMFALRAGHWKMIEGRGSGGFTRPRKIIPMPDQPIGQLYDLQRDPQERSNRWKSHPNRVAELKGLLDMIRQTSGRSQTDATTQ